MRYNPPAYENGVLENAFFQFLGRDVSSDLHIS